MSSQPLLARAILASVIVCFSLAACGDDIQYQAPPNRPAAGSPTPTTTPAPEKIPTHTSDPFAEEGEPAKPEPTPAATTADDGEKLWYSGKIELDPSTVLPPTWTLFISAGYPPEGRPPVLSIPMKGPLEFPLSFELRGKNKAFPDAKVDRPLVLYAILSEKGYVLAKEGVYFRTAATSTLPLETKDAVIVLKKP